jgi:D-alanine--poly(phosphoribitol) ligase subunit 2
MSIGKSVLDVLADVAGVDEVRRNPDLKLFDAHILDSLKTVEFILALGDRLAIDISPAEFDADEWATPAKIVAYFERRAP